MMKIKFKKRYLINSMHKAIMNTDYDLAKEIAMELQDISYILWKHKKDVPFWIKENLLLFNKVFGWIKQEKDCNEEFE